MIGIVLVTHGGQAAEFLAALEHVVGPQKLAMCVCIYADDDMEMRREEILKCISACDAGYGVVVFTDMFGGTPSNLAISVMDRARIEVIAGVNLPMLVKLVGVRGTKSMSDAVAACRDAGRKYITVASRLLTKDAN